MTPEGTIDWGPVIAAGISTLILALAFIINWIIEEWF